MTPEAYGQFTHWLSGLANGRVIVVLEGGYNVNSIGYSMAMCAKALLGDPLGRLEGMGMRQSSAVETIQRVVKVQGKYWKALRGWDKKLPSEVEGVSESERNANSGDQLMEKFGGMSIKGEIGAADAAEGASGVDDKPGSSRGGNRNVSTFDEFMEQQRELLKDEKMFAVYPKRECPHLEELDNDRVIESR